MEAKEITATKRKRSLLSKLLRIFGWIIASLVFLVLLVLILIQLPAVQNIGRKKVISYLEHKLKTKVEIGKLNIKFPTSLSLQKVYIEDQSKDTLLYGGELAVDISMFDLLKNNINIKQIELNNMVVKAKRLPPDSTFNFQFIIDAFVRDNKKNPKVQDTAALKMNIDRIFVRNTHVIYKDLYTGNDMNMVFGKLDAQIKTFDPTHLLFNVPTIVMDSVSGYFHQLEPMHKSVGKVVADAAAKPENYLQFFNKEMRFSNFNVRYKNEAAHVDTKFVIDILVAHPKTIDLKNSIITLNDASLKNSTVTVTTETAKIDKKPTDTTIKGPAPPSLRILSGDINIVNSHIIYDDNSLPHAPFGMDYGHLNLMNLSVAATGLEYSLDTMRAIVKSASLRDTSGFVLNDMTADFEMNPTGVSLTNLFIQTPGSEIKNMAVISYPSLEAIKRDPGVIGLNIDLQNSKITVKDLLTFVPQMKPQMSSLPQNSTLFVDVAIKGAVNNLQFQRLRLRGFNATNIDLTGNIKGLPNPNKLYVNLNIRQFKTTRRDLLAIVPRGSIPTTFTVPESIVAAGRITGNMNNLNTNLAINTSLGKAKLNGSISNLTDKRNARYDMVIDAQNIQLRELLKNPQLGLLTGHIKIKGRGLDPQTANAVFSANIPVVTLNSYTYHNIIASGNIANKNYDIKAIIKDPNLDASIAANGMFEGKFPAVHIDATIDSIKTLPLNFTTTPIIYHGRINGDFTNTDPDNLAGHLVVTHSILLNNGVRSTLDSLEITADNQNGNHQLILKSDFLSAVIEGRYKLTQMADVFQQAIDPYFSISTKKNTAKVDPYHFTISGGVVDNNAIHAFFPGLEKIKPISLNGTFASDSGWNVALKAPYIKYGTTVIDNVNLTAGTKNGSLAFKTTLDKIQSGTSISIYATKIDGDIKDNKINFSLGIKDQKSVDKYTLSGLFAQPSRDHYSFSLIPKNLLLNYDKWSVNSDNEIQYNAKDIVASNFVLSHGTESLSLNSIGNGIHRPLKVDFKNFSIATLTGFVQNDSLMVTGLLNGNAVVKNISTQPAFTSDLIINDLSIYKDTIGDLTAKINNNIANNYQADISLRGRGNEVNINGKYIVDPTNSRFDLVADVVKLQMTSLEGFTKGQIRDARGFLYGKINANGTIKDPNIDGKINFDNTAFNVKMINNVFKVDKEAIAIINNEGIKLNTFTIRDTADNALVIDGTLNTKNWFDYVFDLRIKGDNFQAINSTNKDNKLFYGKMVFSTNLTVKGSTAHPIVDGDLTINDKTDFTVVLPQTDPGVEKREGIVRFVDYSATAEDSLLMAPYDSLKVSPLVGYDVSVNINVSRLATFNMIVDQANGDFLKLRGIAQLTGGIDASGKITLTGSYEIDEGSYDLSYNFIKRKFLIQKGSRIVWTGDPTTAQLAVTAIYIANTAPLDLVQGQTEGNPVLYKQKLPFEVHLEMRGELLKPQISFDIVLPEDKNYNVSDVVLNTTRAKLSQLRQEPAEITKQVFALLLLNRFVGQNPFDNSSGSGLDAGTFARQSVSRLLTEQLNNLTAGLIDGVDINFDLATTQDYTTGSLQNRTDFNVGITKRLLSDRLTITVGSNFELQGPTPVNGQQNNVAGNININYKLSKDGRYALRAYRKNDYTGTVEGYVIETGIGFVISIDYDKFKEILISKEQRRKKREIKKKNKEISKQDAERKQKVEATKTPAAAALENTKQDEKK
ncbi:MAG: translocation/assembly module TamB domain-containing protein [Ginsengibacter sp.]